MSNAHEGVSRFLKKDAPPLEELLVSTPFPRLYLLTGDNLIPGTASIPFFVKRRLLSSLERLPADFVLLDLGSGTHPNVLDFFLISRLGLVVTAPETTAVLNAYGFLKNAVYRMLLLAFPAKHPARTLIQDFAHRHIEGTDGSFAQLPRLLGQKNPADGQKAEHLLQSFRPAVVVNLVRQRGELNLAANLKAVVHRHLGIELSFLSILPWEDDIRLAVNSRQPLVLSRPNSPWLLGLDRLARVIYQLGETTRLDLAWDEQDLEEAERRAQALGLF